MIDILTYKNWYWNTHIYGMSYAAARRIYRNAKSYEKKLLFSMRK